MSVRSKLICDDFCMNLLLNLTIKRSHQIVNQRRKDPITFLKPKQIDCLLQSIDSEGETTDVLAILPTGYGKSLLFELIPVYCQLRLKSTTYKALIISPLNAIIQQQKINLGGAARILNRTVSEDHTGSDSDLSRSPSSLRAAVAALTLSEETEIGSDDDEENTGTDSSDSSSDTLEDSSKEEADEHLYFLGHPEDFLDKNVIREFTRATWAESVSHIFIDEAHCTVQWSDEFRPLYRDLDILRSLFPKAAVVACTATATTKMQKDIKRLLNMKNTNVVSCQQDRHNIKYCVKRRPAQTGKGGVETSYTTVFAPLLNDLKQMGMAYPKTIVYTGLKWCGFGGELGVKLLSSGELTSAGVTEVAQFHAPLTAKTKQDVASTLGKDDSPIRLLFATEAFGMGVDCPDIRHVVNAGPPTTLETYSQETGRAGRDGQDAEATLFFNNEDLGRSTVTSEMREYCRLQECRRHFLANHFGIKTEGVNPLHRCCDVCEKKCTCIGCTTRSESEEEEEETVDSSKRDIIQNALEQYFVAVNETLQESNPIDVSIFSALTPELASEIASSYNHLCGEDVLTIAFPFLEENIIKTVIKIISGICSLSD